MPFLQIPIFFLGAIIDNIININLNFFKCKKLFTLKKN